MEKGKMIATRDGFGDEIVEVGKENKNIYVVDVDIGKSCKTAKFMKALPEQYVNVGIARAKRRRALGRTCHHRQDPVCS